MPGSVRRRRFRFAAPCATGRGMTSRTRGLLAAALCYAIWGLTPIFYKALANVTPLEVMAHRTLWSAASFALVLAAQGRLSRLRPLLTRRLGRTALAGAAIGNNWFLFIFAVATGQTLESSLGYYILPLGTALAGWALFGERLGARRLLAIAIAACGIAVLGAGAGAPRLSLLIMGTFLVYSVVKKGAAEDPVATVCAEAIVLLPLALLWLALAHGGMPAPFAAHVDPEPWSAPVSGPGAFGQGLVVTLLLMASGPLTAGPLLLFSYAARHAELGQVGFLIYLNSTLQFLCAVFLFGEAFTLLHGIGFAAIWLALGLYSLPVRRAFPA